MALALPHLLLVGKPKGVCSSVPWTMVSLPGWSAVGRGDAHHSPSHPPCRWMTPGTPGDCTSAANVLFPLGIHPQILSPALCHRAGEIWGHSTFRCLWDIPPYAWCCPAHDEQPDMTSCHPSPGALVPSLCPRVSGLPLHCLPLLLTLAGHPARTHSHTSVAGKLAGDAANPPSVSSTPSCPGATSLCRWDGECNNLLLQGTLESGSFHCLA